MCGASTVVPSAKHVAFFTTLSVQLVWLQVCEKHCYREGGSRQVYRGKLANAVRAIAGAAQLSALPCDAAELRRALLAVEDGDGTKPQGAASSPRQPPPAPSNGVPTFTTADACTIIS